MNLQQAIEQLNTYPCAMSRRQVLDDLAQLTLNTVSVMTQGVVWFHPDMLMSLERYQRHPEAWQCLQDAVTCYLDTVKQHDPFTDILGPLYDTELGKEHGQFMTPPNLSDSAMRFLGGPSHGDTIADPTCGTGALLLAQLRQRHDVHVIGNDLNLGVLKVAACDLVVGSLTHQRPFQSLKLYCSDIIKEYTKTNKLMVKI